LAAEVMRELLQRGVDSRAVETLRIVVDDQLPVRRHLVDDPPAQPELVHPPGSEPLFEPAEPLLERSRLRPQVEEDISVPEVHRRSVQWVILCAETGHPVHLGGRDEATVEVIGPSMVRALNRRCEGPRALRAQPRSSMAADIVERVQLPALAPDQDEALAR